MANQLDTYLTGFDELLTRSTKFISESESDGWTLFDQSGGAAVYTKQTPDSPIQCVKASVVIKHSPEKVRDFCWAMKEADFQRFDSACTKLVDIEENENTKIRESITSLPWPIWARQLVFAMHKCADSQGRLWILQKTVTHPKVPLNPEKFVRANLIIGAFCFELSANGECKFSRLFLLDPCGDIPSFAINANLGKMGGILKFIRDEMK